MRKIAFAQTHLFLDMLFEVIYETAKTAQPLEVIGTNDHVRQWDDVNTLETEVKYTDTDTPSV